MGRHGRREEAYVARGAPVSGERGFTLIEVMIAIIIMTVGLLAVASVFPPGLVLSMYGKDQSKAANLAQRWVEDLKNGPIATIAADVGDFGTVASQYYDSNGNGTTAAAAVFTVDLQIEYWVWNAGTGQYVESGSPWTLPGSGQYMYRVSAATHWLQNGHTVFTSGHLASPNGCVVGGAEVPTGPGCIMISTLVEP